MSYEDIAGYFMDALSQFALSVLNAPIKPVLAALKFLVTTPATLDILHPIWAAMVYVISVFYGLFILGAGFNFIISGMSAERRTRAKEWLQNAILMMLFVQSSFLLYGLIAQIAASLTSGVVGMIDPNFFLFTIDDGISTALQMTFGSLYLVTICITLILLSINYLGCLVGAVFFPFGVFFYFIPPLRDIGKFIMSSLAFILFIPFFASLIFLVNSELMKVGYYDTLKIFFMIGSFWGINIMMLLLAVLAIVRAVMGLLRTDIARGVLFLKGQFLAGSALKKEEKTAEPPGREHWAEVRKDYRE